MGREHKETCNYRSYFDFPVTQTCSEFRCLEEKEVPQKQEEEEEEEVEEGAGEEGWAS